MTRQAWMTLLQVTGILGGSLAVFYLLPLEGEAWPIGSLIGLAVLIGLLPLAVHQARRVLRSRHPWSRAVVAVTLLFALLITGMSATHFALAEHHPAQYHGIATRTDALYFTVTVFSTVGFGDITPTGETARAITTAQMVFDLILIGVVVRLVSWAARRAAGEPAEPGGPEP